jgi:nucleoside 2-deoxyribosyltransferase
VEASVLKVVVCGSYGDMKTFVETLINFRLEHGNQNVFPNERHLQRSSPCIEAHHGKKGETEATIETRSKLMKSYFERIDHADLVVIVNEKNGAEYYGVGTTVELGYAFAKGKTIRFTRKPTNPNILSLVNGQHNNQKKHSSVMNKRLARLGA